MLRRWSGASELVVVLSALALGGCVEVLDLDRFSIGGDAGRDAGGRDGGGVRDASGGRDGCALATYYADLDGDTYGDPGTAIESCTPIEGHVTVGDDCDDSNNAIRPGVTETCDDVDQDCDGAVDEGLMRPLGAPTVVVPDYGFVTANGADVVATADGYAVIWRRAAAATVRASFFAPDGAPFDEDVFIAGRSSTGTGPEASGPVATRFTMDGVEQVLIAWAEPDRLRAVLCTPRGDCSVAVTTIMSGDTADLGGLRLAQLGNRVMARWDDSGASWISSFDPWSGTASPPLELPRGPEAADDVEILGLATVEGPEPYTLVARSYLPEDAGDAGAPSLDGGTLALGHAELLRIRGEDVLQFDAEVDVLPWDGTDRCAATGRPFCGVLSLSPTGHSTPAQPNLLFLETLFAGDLSPDAAAPVLSTCAFGGRPRPDGAPMPAECTALGMSAAVFAAVRGSVATVGASSGAGYGLRDVPIDPRAEGGGATSLPLDLFIGGSGSRISMSGAHGAAIGADDLVTGADLSVQRIGCAP